MFDLLTTTFLRPFFAFQGPQYSRSDQGDRTLLVFWTVSGGASHLAGPAKWPVSRLIGSLVPSRHPLYLSAVTPITVSHLTVESVTGPTCYPGENGFSALTGYVKSDDPAIIGQFRKAANEGSTVVVRCARLEIEGRVGNLEVTTGEMKGAVAIAIHSVRDLKPKAESAPGDSPSR